MAPMFICTPASHVIWNFMENPGIDTFTHYPRVIAQEASHPESHRARALLILFLNKKILIGGRRAIFPLPLFVNNERVK